MSQYVRVNCQVLDNVKGGLIKKTLEEMHDNLTLKNVDECQGMIRTELIEDADVIVCKNGMPMSIGLKLTEVGQKNKLSIMGDFWNTGYNQKDFTDQFCKSYQLVSIRQLAKERGMNLLHSKQEADGTIVLRYAV